MPYVKAQSGRGDGCSEEGKRSENARESVGKAKPLHDQKEIAFMMDRGQWADGAIISFNFLWHELDLSLSRWADSRYVALVFYMMLWCDLVQ